MTAKTRSALTTQANTDLANNTTKDISPTDIRTMCIDIIDSMAIGLSDSFTTADQTITPAGSLTIAHGLSGTPTVEDIMLVNTGSEFNWSVADVVSLEGLVHNHGADQGIAVWVDATNINVRFGAGQGAGNPVFSILDRTTGTTNNITNSNWDIRIKVKL